jgi:hypothetical protein
VQRILKAASSRGSGPVADGIDNVFEVTDSDEEGAP